MVVIQSCHHALDTMPPFLARALGVATGQLQHRVLYDIQRIVVVAHGNPGDTKCALLDADKKAVQRAHLIQSLFSTAAGAVSRPRLSAQAGKEAARRVAEGRMRSRNLQ